ncbi:MAG: DUF5683 domain-containing protein [Bacteroidales bacterium]
MIKIINLLSNFTFYSPASIRFLTLVMVLFFEGSLIFAQNESTADSIAGQLNDLEIDQVSSPTKEHSPHKATIYSMLLPGLGQAYNKKYWKIPIVYAGLGVFYYLIRFNNDEYQQWSEAYYFVQANPGEDLPGNEYVEKYGDDPDFLKSNKDYYRRNRDLNYILMAVWYLLNIVDATVDAHLYSWEVDDNLSLRLEPEIYNGLSNLKYKPAAGLKLSLRF